MRWLKRIVLCFVFGTLLITCICAAWFYFYSADLPDMSGLRRYAPKQATRVSDPCLSGDSIAIPHDAIGSNLRAALNSSEGAERQGQVNLRMQVSRSLFCAPSQMLERHISEWRAAEQMRWRFSANELLTIYANRASFGENLIGVEAASRHYFGKEPNQLDIAQAALLAGLIKQPPYLSPEKHPDRALQRRNQVIDEMVASRAISLEQGAEAKAMTLSLARK